jgi:hypothetical protein
MATSTAGRIASAPQTVQCPDWCVIDHGDDPIDDIFHRGAYMQAGVPADQVHYVDADLKLVAHLCLPSAPQPGEEGGFLVVDPGDMFGPYAELDLEHTDQLIRDLKTFTARIEQARDVLAALKEQQS